MRNMNAPREFENTAATTGDVDQESAEDLRAQLATLRQEHETFRTLVRDRAISGFRDSQWGLDSLNETLERLGLETHEPRYVSRGEVTLEFRVEIDESDSYRGETALRQLEHTEVGEALRQAVASVLNERTVDGHAVTVSDGYFRAQTGYVDQVMV
jgi:hypothetical protein